MKKLRQAFGGEVQGARLCLRLAVVVTFTAVGFNSGKCEAADSPAGTSAGKTVKTTGAAKTSASKTSVKFPTKAGHSKVASGHAVTTEEKKRAAASLMSPMKASLDEGMKPRTAPPVETNKMRSKRFLKEGARLHRIGEYADAERLFKQAVAMDPRNPDAFFNLGALAEGRGDLVDALTQYRAGLALMPQDKSLKEAVDSMESRLASGQGSVNAQINSGGYTASSFDGSADSGRTDIGRWSSNFRHPPTMFSNPNPTAEFSETPLLGVNAPEPPQVSQFSDPPPILPATSNGPFQLSSTQNAALAGVGGTNVGTYNVLNSSPPPTLSVSQRPGGGGRRVAGATLNAALRVGVRAALSGTGLHCPACHFLRF